MSYYATEKEVIKGHIWNRLQVKLHLGVASGETGNRENIFNNMIAFRFYFRG